MFLKSIERGLAVRKPESLPSAKSTARQDTHKAARPRGGRPAPAMQVITKGWWTLREERAPVEELEREDRDERKRAYSEVGNIGDTRRHKE